MSRTTSHSISDARLPSHRRQSIPQPSPNLNTLPPTTVLHVREALVLTDAVEPLNHTLTGKLSSLGYLKALQAYIEEAARKLAEEDLEERDGRYLFGVSGGAGKLFEERLRQLVVEDIRAKLPVLGQLEDREAGSALTLKQEDLDEVRLKLRNQLWRCLDFIGVESS